jgi:hypothetical protein
VQQAAVPARVELFDDQRPARVERLGQFAEDVVPVGQVGQDQPGVDQVEPAG